MENQVLDDLLDGEFYDRGEFLRRGTMLGLSVSALSAALLAAGEAPLAFAQEETAQIGGRFRVGIVPAPTGPLEPQSQIGSGVSLLR